MSLVSGWNLGVMWQPFHTQIYAETQTHADTIFSTHKHIIIVSSETSVAFIT